MNWKLISQTGIGIRSKESERPDRYTRGRVSLVRVVKGQKVGINFPSIICICPLDLLARGKAVDSSKKVGVDVLNCA